MLTYVIRRLLYAVLTFFGIIIAVFFLVHSVPGDPVPFLLYPPGFSVTGLMAEAGTAVALFAIFP